MNIHFTLIKALVIAFSFTLFACGGGGGSSTPADTGGTATTITGTAEAPGGTIALFENNKTFTVAAIEYTFPSAIAGITGLQPVTGATVNLIRIDDNGIQISDVLATTSTSITGSYSLTLPEGVSLAGNLIVRISGNVGVSMSAMVVDQVVNINPVSQYILNKFVDDENLILADLPVNEVVVLTGKAEEFDLAATADLSSMLTQLEAELGALVDTEIAIIQSTPDDGTASAAVAGTWSSVTFSLGMQDQVDNQSGQFNMDLTAENFTIADAGSGIINITLGGTPLIDVHTGYSLSSHGVQIHRRISLDNEVNTFQGLIDANNNISVSFPFEEDLHVDANDIDNDGPNSGSRTPPGTIIVHPVANGNTAVLQEIETRVRYATIDTNSDGINDAIDPNVRLGSSVNMGLDIILKLGDNMSNTSLSGDYGMVALSINLETSPQIIMGGTVGILELNGAGNGSVALDTQKVTSTPTEPLPSVTLSPSEEASTINFGYTVKTNGELTIDNTFVGFTNNDGSVIAVVDDDTSGDPITRVDNEMMVMVKLGNSMATSLNGTNYKIFPLAMNADTSGDSELFTLGNGLATFSADASTAVISGTERGFTRASPVLAIEALAPDAFTADFTVGPVTANGALTMSYTDQDNHSVTLKGFVSADSNLLIMRLYGAKQDGSEYDLGMVIGIKQ